MGEPGIIERLNRIMEEALEELEDLEELEEPEDLEEDRARRSRSAPLDPELHSVVDNRDVRDIPKSRCLTIYRKTSSSTSDLCLKCVKTEPCLSEPFQFQVQVDNLSELYIEKCPKTKDFNMYIPVERSQTSPWKGMKHYVRGMRLYTEPARNASRQPLFWVLDKVVRTPKHLEAAGIHIQFSIDSKQCLKLYFMMDQSRILEKIEDVQPILRDIFQQNTQLVLRTIIHGIDKTKDLPYPFPIREVPEDERLFQQFENFYATQKKVKRQIGEQVSNYDLRLEELNCNLMSYQKDTVRWMMNREIGDSEYENDPIWNSSEELSGFHYYPHLGVLTRHKSPWDPEADFMKLFNVKGGIVADEMGLGKTVQVLSLISAHRKSDEGSVNVLMDGVEEEEEDERKGSGGSAAEQMKIAERSYNELKSAKTVTTPTCFTATNISDPVKCTVCKLNCSASVCGWKFPKSMEFVCPACLSKADRKEVKTTLIILPESLIHQWFTEIAKHCPESLKVMFYFGVQKHGYLPSYEMEKYDVILTTYSTLTAEVKFSEDRGPVRNLRRNVVHHFITSSLMHVKFWRVIVDESQQIPSSNAGKLAKMLQNIQARNWWCISGTPLIRSINDIQNTFQFMNLFPFAYPDYWNDYAIPQYFHHPEKSVLMACLARIMSRKTKEEVEGEMKLPELVEIERKVQFSAIEERQYKEAKEEFKQAIAKHVQDKPSDTLLIHTANHEKVMSELKYLREMILTGQNPGKIGEGGGDNCVYAPETVIFKLVHEKKKQIMQLFRDYSKAEMDIAGCRLLEQDDQVALNSYGKILEKYREIQDFEAFIVETIGADQILIASGGAPAAEEDSEEQEGGDEDAKKNPTKFLKIILQTLKKYKPRLPRARPKPSDEPKAKKMKLADNVTDKPIDNDMQDIEKEKKAQTAFSQKQAKQAFKRMRIEALHEFHVKLNMYKVEKRIGTPTTATMNELEAILKAYYEKELNCLQSASEEANHWRLLWNQPFNNEIRVYFEKWADHEKKNPPMVSKASFYSLNDKMDGEFLKKIGSQMPFNPFYEVDNATQSIRHQTLSCMGDCDNKHRCVEVYAKALNEVIPFHHILSKTREHLLSLKTKREDIETDGSVLLEMLQQLTRPAKIYQLLNSNRSADRYQGRERVFMRMFNCSHAIIKGTPEEKEKVLKKSYKPFSCILCRFYTDIAWLRFNAGFSTYHGFEKIKNGVCEFIYYLLNQIPMEKKGATEFLRETISPYFSRLQDFIKIQLNTVSICLELLNRYTELQKAMALITEEQLLGTLSSRDFDPTNPTNLRQVFAQGRTTQGTKHWKSAKIVMGELRYLINLLKEQISGVAMMQDCLICLCPMESFMVYTCGHRICVGCWEMAKEQSGGNPRNLTEPTVLCCKCRKESIVQQVMIAKSGHSEEDAVIEGMVVSAKMTGAIKLMRELLAADPTNKIILFTSVDPHKTPVWNYLQKLLRLAKLPHSVMDRGAGGVGRKVVDFDVSQEKKILLCSLPMCSNGLNMTSANHIIFLDPPHVRSVLLQAIGRINRFGQKREMKVWHMIVEGSVDVWMRNSSLKEQQRESKTNSFTCGDIRAVFDIEYVRVPVVRFDQEPEIIGFNRIPNQRHLARPRNQFAGRRRFHVPAPPPDSDEEDDADIQILHVIPPERRRDPPAPPAQAAPPAQLAPPAPPAPPAPAAQADLQHQLLMQQAMALQAILAAPGAPELPPVGPQRMYADVEREMEQMRQQQREEQQRDNEQQ